MKRAWPYALLGAITLAAFWKFLFLGQTLYDIRTLEAHLGDVAEESSGWFQSNRPGVDRGDTILSLPMLYRIYNEGLKNGELRLWNPQLFCGAPLYNNLLVHPFYPPNLLLHTLLPARTAFDLNLLFHFFFSGAAMYALLRGMGRSEPAAVAGAILWMLCGYNSHWFSTGTFMGASVFAPLSLLAIIRGLERRSLALAGLAGAAQGLTILGSHGQHALHVMIFLAVWLLVTLIRDREARPFTIRFIGLFSAAAIGVGMAAILTQLDSITNGYREAGGDIDLLYGDPLMLPAFLLGGPLGKVLYPFGDLLRSEFTIYAGAAGVALALIGAVRDFRDARVRLLAIFGAAALLVAFVRPLAIAALQIPLLNLSMPSRWVYVAGFCGSILAASGLDSLKERMGRVPHLMSAAAGLFLIACFTGLGRFRLSHGAAIETLIGLALAAGAAWVALRSPRLGLGLCFAAILFDLLPGFLCFNLHADPRPLSEIPEAVRLVKETETSPWRASGSPRRAGASPLRDSGWTVSVGNNLLALYGVETVAGYESLAPKTFVRYCTEAGGMVAGSGRVLLLGDLDSPLLDAANLKYVFMPFQYEPGGRYRKLGEWGPMRLYENPSVLPRARLVWRAVAARTLQGADLRTTAVLEDAEIPPLGSPGEGRVVWKERSTDRIALEVATPSDALLVLSDTHYPGWEAERDGAPVPIYRANLNFRAVAVPAGTHQITFRFRPDSARTGLWVTAFSILVVAGAWIHSVRRNVDKAPGSGILPSAL